MAGLRGCGRVTNQFSAWLALACRWPPRCARHVDADVAGRQLRAHPAADSLAVVAGGAGHEDQQQQPADQQAGPGVQPGHRLAESVLHAQAPACARWHHQQSGGEDADPGAQRAAGGERPQRRAGGDQDRPAACRSARSGRARRAAPRRTHWSSRPARSHRRSQPTSVTARPSAGWRTRCGGWRLRAVHGVPAGFSGRGPAHRSAPEEAIWPGTGRRTGAIHQGQSFQRSVTVTLRGSPQYTPL